jgi:hypothetical protein
MAQWSKSDLFAAVAVALLLILTALGNAVAMLVVSAVTLAAGFIVWRGKLGAGGLLAAVMAAIIGVVIALVFMVIHQSL